MKAQLRLASIVCCIVIFAAGCSSAADTATAELPTIESTTTTAPVDETSTTEGEEDGGPADDGTTATEEPVDPDIALAEYEKCMADLGIELDTEVMSGGDSFDTLDEVPEDAVIGDELDLEDFEAAQAECGPILEGSFGSFEMSPEQEAEMADEMLRMEKCIAEQGFEIDLSGGGFEIGQDIDFEAFNEAMSTCQPGLPPLGDQ